MIKLQSLVITIMASSTLAISTVVNANNVKIVPSVSLSQIYTDNLEAFSDAKAEEEFITELSPELTIQGVGRRAEVDLNYSLSTYYHAKEEENNFTEHFLDADANFKLVRNFLFLDTKASVSQQVIDPKQSVSRTFNPDDSNRTDETIFTLAPYINYKFSDSVTSQAYFSKSWVEYDSAEVSDKGVEEFSLSFQQKERSSPINWDINYSDERHLFDTQEKDARFKYATISLGYLVRPKLRLLLDGGYENNDYESSADISNEGSFWKMGLNWTPTRRTNVAAKFGELFFGKTYQLAFSHDSKRNSIDIDYQESVVTAASARLQGTHQDADVVTATSLSNNDVFINKRLGLFISVTHSKNIFSILAFNERRDFQVLNEREQGYGAGLGWEWRLSRRNVIKLNTFGDKQKYPGDGDYNTLKAKISMKTRVGKRLSTSFSYDYSKRDSNDSLDSYTENVVRAKATWVFGGAPQDRQD